MTVLMVLAACFLTAFMCFKMIEPFLKDRDAALRFELLDEDLRQIEELMQRKSLYVDHLREIETDLQLEKITPQDHVQLKRRYEREIILIMRRLDELHGGKGWEERVQQAIDSTVAASPSPEAVQVAPPQPEHAEEDVPVEAEPPSPAAIVCPSCQHPLAPKDRFCSQCATPNPYFREVSDAAGAATPTTQELHS